jgi:hypothetical protein
MDKGQNTSMDETVLNLTAQRLREKVKQIKDPRLRKHAQAMADVYFSEGKSVEQSQEEEATWKKRGWPNSRSTESDGSQFTWPLVWLQNGVG